MLPGGPGIGSESLIELADAMDVPGTIWLVDLPGDGSNIDPRGAAPDIFAKWPGVLVEAAEALPNAIYVGHSTGGMYLLATPELERHIAGLVLISSAPHAGWIPRYEAMTRSDPLPSVDAAMLAYATGKSAERLRDVAVASAPWNFADACLNAGRDLLSRMPYNVAAVEWSDANFDRTYAANWWPKITPVLIISGAEDRIVDQALWDDPRFQETHVTQRIIDGGGHFPWIENPGQVRQAFSTFIERFI
jgi:pimeloyl-ACP methyl ester carboxylesterase